MPSAVVRQGRNHRSWETLPISDADRVHRETCRRPFRNCFHCMWADHKILWQERWTWVKLGTHEMTGQPGLGCTMCEYAARHGASQRWGTEKWARCMVTCKYREGAMLLWRHERSEGHKTARVLFHEDRAAPVASVASSSTPAPPPAAPAPGSPGPGGPPLLPRPSLGRKRSKKSTWRACVRLYKILCQVMVRNRLRTRKSTRGTEGSVARRLAAAASRSQGVVDNGLDNAVLEQDSDSELGRSSRASSRTPSRTPSRTLTPGLGAEDLTVGYCRQSQALSPGARAGPWLAIMHGVP